MLCCSQLLVRLVLQTPHELIKKLPLLFRGSKMRGANVPSFSTPLGTPELPGGAQLPQGVQVYPKADPSLPPSLLPSFPPSAGNCGGGVVCGKSEGVGAVVSREDCPA